MVQWTVNPYVASSSLARGASFYRAFVTVLSPLFLTVVKSSLILQVSDLLKS